MDIKKFSFLTLIALPFLFSSCGKESEEEVDTDVDNIVLFVDGTKDLGIKGDYLTSDNRFVASVDADGIVKGKSCRYDNYQHKSILGFKSLTLAITDGISQMVLDFALLGEPGKKGNFSMTAKELAGRYSKTRPEDTAVQERINEYSQSKIKLTIDMIRRAIGKGVRFRYILADSWFACADIIRFATSRHIGCDYLGMIKVGEKGRTKYRFERNDLTI